MDLVISHLSKVYPNGVRALNDISLTIPSGMFGLLGPNGAGKSTLMRTIATLQEPDSGSIHLGDLDVLGQKDAVRRVLGYLPQEFGFYPNLSAETILDHFATLKGLTRKNERKQVVGALLQQTNLYEARKKSVGGFSGGMRQRLGIATALLGDPKLIIVDEPTAGLDPTERNRFLNLLSEISEKRRRDLLDPHRRRHPRAVLQHGDHRARRGGRAGDAGGCGRAHPGARLEAHGREECAGRASADASGHLDPAGRRQARRPRLQRDAAGA